MTHKIRVLIADDHKHERKGFKDLLSIADDIEVVGEVDSAHKVVQEATKNEPDVILLDLAWDGDESAGPAAIEKIKAKTPAVRILAVTAYRPLIEKARAAGAEVAIDKNSLHDEYTLANRVRDAYHTDRFPKLQADNSRRLSERELDVLKLMAQGYKNEQIAGKLCIAIPTVKNHVRSIMNKLGADNRGGAIAVAYEEGILKRGELDI